MTRAVAAEKATNKKMRRTNDAETFVFERWENPFRTRKAAQTLNPANMECRNLNVNPKLMHNFQL
jgi:hypothetical protein